MSWKSCASAGLALCTVVLCAAEPAVQKTAVRHNRLVDLLSRQQVVFGWFAPGRTPDVARRAAGDPLMDFVFVNMEQVASYSPGDIRTFLDTMAEAGVPKTPNSHPLMARLPIFHDDPAAARQRIAEMLDLGVPAIVFPGMESAEEASAALAAMRYAPNGVRPGGVGEAAARWGASEQDYRRKADVYPVNPEGELASVFIVESEKGIVNSREITRTKPTVAIPGPGTLRRVFKGDMEKVEGAIQTQLASCKAFSVPCGITANAADVEKRIKEGFRVIIIYDRDYNETIAVGRKAAGR
jgi:4-hydroxy-2-oxoheptanedioate aldolase